MAKEKKGGGKKNILEAARKHQNALQGAGLSVTVIDRYEIALKGILNAGKGPNPAAQTLIKDLQGEVAEIQAAIKKDFPSNVSFHKVFKADEPMPQEPREVLALGRLVLKEAPDYSQNLIKYAINQASFNHLKSLLDQLDKELGGLDPEAESKELEAQIVKAAQHAFEGKPELAAFEGK